MTNRYIHRNLNPGAKNVGDCTVRAIALATDQSWDKVYLDLCIEGYVLADMPSANDVWSQYLLDRGWIMHRLPDTCPLCYSLEDFCRDHEEGTYIVWTGTHVICVKSGRYYDAWDSGEKTVHFYFAKE